MKGLQAVAAAENAYKHSVDAAMDHEVKGIEEQVAELEDMIGTVLGGPKGQLRTNFEKELEDSKGLRHMLIKDLQRCTMFGQSALDLETQMKSAEGIKRKLLAERDVLDQREDALLADGDAHRQALRRALSLRRELASSMVSIADLAKRLGRNKLL